MTDPEIDTYVEKIKQENEVIIKEKNAEISKLKAQLAAEKKIRDELEDQLEELRGILESQKKKIRQLELEPLTSSLSGDCSDGSGINSRTLDRLRKKLEEEEKARDTVEKQLRDVERKARRDSGKIEELKAESDLRVEMSTLQIEALKKELQREKETIDKLRKQRAEQMLQLQPSSDSTGKDEHKKEISSLTKEIERLKREVNDEKDEVERLKKRIRNNSSRRGSTDISNPNSIYAEAIDSKFEEKIKDLAIELERTKRDYQQEKTEAEKLRKDLMDLKERQLIDKFDSEKKGAESPVASFAFSRHERKSSGEAKSSSNSISGSQGDFKLRTTSSSSFLISASNNAISAPVPAINWLDIKINKRIGGGGYAEVFEGIYFGEKVAVKKLTTQDFTGDAKKELMLEVEVMSKLRSGFIVALYGACFQPPNLCMVMEYFPRGSLGFILWDKSVKLSWERRWSFVGDAINALLYLHSRNPAILHRDIKSANYLVTSDWKLKLTDFGCSVEAGQGATAPTPVHTAVGKQNLSLTGSNSEVNNPEFLGGTLTWTGPEVLDGKEYTDKADVYSFGMVMFEIASRKLPWSEYDATSQGLLIRRMVGEGKRPVLPDETPEDFKKIYEQCIVQDPNDRPNCDKIVKLLQRKGHIKVDTEEPASDEGLEEERSRLEEESKLHKQLLDNAERRAEDAVKTADREKKKRIDFERRLEEFERDREADRENKSQLEKLKDELLRNNESLLRKLKEIEAQKETFEKKAKKEKKKIQQLKDEKEQAEKRAEEAERKADREKKRADRMSVPS